MIPAKTWSHRTLRFSHSRIEELTLAPTVRRVPVCAQEQRNMKLRFPVPHLKRNLDYRIERRNLLCDKVTRRVERQSIPSRRHLIVWQQLAATAVLVRA